jgi:hypothetical protein
VTFISAFSLGFFAEGSNIIYAYALLSVFTAISALVLLANRRQLLAV